MKKYLLLAIAMPVFALQTETIHSSLATYYESKNYTNSLQKESAQVYGIGADIHIAHHKYKAAFESTYAITKKPPLDKNLKNNKIFLRYGYTYNNFLELHCNYLQVLHDNIAITSGGYAYGGGVVFVPHQTLTLQLNHYITKYDPFRVYQTDVRLDYATIFYGIKTTLSSLNKYISIDDIYTNSFTKNAHKEYFTSGIKLHLHYKSYHLGGGAYFGKRAFAIMNDGFKIQHHAMEIHKNYALGIGKSFAKQYIFRLQYIYAKAKELPMQHNNVTINSVRFLLNYKV